jgi:uncharacterized protein (TIGR02444 family)
MPRILSNALTNHHNQTPTMHTTPDALWDFAVTLYQQPGVEAQCLQLQDTYGVRVTPLLFITWLDINGKNPGFEALQQALTATDTWHRQVTVALRATRRWIKQQGPLSESQHQCREHLKAAELAAERWELTQLAERAAHWSTAGTAPQLPQVRDYLAQCHVAPPVVARTLAILQKAHQRG